MPVSPVASLRCGLSSLTGHQLVALADLIAANTSRNVIELIINLAFEAFDRASEINES
jgi:hypothetical protein